MLRRRPSLGFVIEDGVLRARPGSLRHAQYLGIPATGRPGVAMVTVLDQPDRLTTDEFLHHWTRSHTPMSLAWLPLTGYVRNHVVRALDPDAPPTAGIVVELFAEIDDIIDPARFLSAVGQPELLAERQRATIEDVTAFLDLDRVEVHIMSEHLL